MTRFCDCASVESFGDYRTQKGFERKKNVFEIIHCHYPFYPLFRFILQKTFIM